jgi:anti-sigma B factor antagonist
MAAVARIVALPTGSSLVQLTGELDIASVPSLSDHVVCAMNLSEHLIIDLREVTFIDAAVIGALQGARRRAVAKGGDLVLVGATPSVAKVLRLAKVTDVLRLLPDLRTALTSEVSPRPATLQIRRLSPSADLQTRG